MVCLVRWESNFVVVRIIFNFVSIYIEETLYITLNPLSTMGSNGHQNDICLLNSEDTLQIRR